MSKPPCDVIPAKARLGEAWAGIQKLLRSGVEMPVAPQEQFFVWPHLLPKKWILRALCNENPTLGRDASI